MRTASTPLVTARGQLEYLTRPRPRDLEPERPAPDARALWNSATSRTLSTAEEFFLARRGVTFRDPELIRSGRPLVADKVCPWFSRKVAAGWRIILPLVDASGELRDLALRFLGTPMNPNRKVLCLPSISTLGLAWHRPGTAEVRIVEGLTDGLRSASEYPDAEVLAVPGPGLSAAALAAFAARVAGRDVVLDCAPSPLGDANLERAIAAAWEVGAASVARVTR